MPAIHLDRLRKQLADLTELFREPPAFSNYLHDLFEIYADRTQRPGQSGEPPPLLKPYNVPTPILRSIIKEISFQVEENPEAALNLCDYLWNEPYLEFRLLAIRLLGSISPQRSESIFSRIYTWLDPNLEEFLLNTLLDDGFASVRDKAPEIILIMIENWLSSKDDFYIKVGLLTLKHIILKSKYDDASTIFRLLNPFIRRTPKQLRPEVLAILKVLANNFPKETAYHFGMNLSPNISDDTAWYIRRCLDDFPNEIQSHLRLYLRSYNQASET